VADEAGDVLQSFGPSTNNAVTTARRPACVPSWAVIPAVLAACSTTFATAWRSTSPPRRGEHQVHRLALVGDRLPVRRGDPFLVLRLAALGQQSNDRGHEPVLAPGTVGLGWRELLALPST
jgi:hypothetical protein